MKLDALNKGDENPIKEAYNKGVGDTTNWPLGYEVSDPSTDVSATDVSIKRPSETSKLKHAVNQQHTAPQMSKLVGDLQARIYDGKLAKGNVELAALLGHEPSARALGRQVGDMSQEELIEFLLTDPNLKIRIRIG